LNIWSDNEDHITFGGASTHLVSAWESFKIWINNDSGDAGTLHLYNTSSKTEFVRLTGSGSSWINGGNVGISTTSPGAGLDVQNSNGTFRQKNFTTMVTNNLAANGTQARRFEIARLSIDYNDWNALGTLEVELHERYYSRGLKKRYSIYYGYVSASGCNLVEMSGSGDNQFQVTLGPEVVISGDIRYIPVYVEVRYYSQVNAVL
jgi:hypothetical protein